MILGLAFSEDEFDTLLRPPVEGNSPALIEMMKARAERYGRSLFVRSGNDAVIRVHGTLDRQMSYFGWLYGCTLYSEITAAIEQAERDPAITRIVLDIDSRGGVVVGGLGCAERIRGATKPTVAFVTGYACSMAYLLASAAQKVVAIQSAMVGNVGTILQWVDRSKAREEAGYELRVLRSSLTPRKNLDPGTPEGEAAQQSLLDEMAVELVTAIGRYRGIEGDAQAIANALGAGDAMLTDRALEAKLIDEVAAEVPPEHTPAARRPLNYGGHMAGENAAPGTGSGESMGQGLTLEALKRQVDEQAAELAKVRGQAAEADRRAAEAEAARLKAEAQAKADATEQQITRIIGSGAVEPWLEPIVRAIYTGSDDDIEAARKVLDEQAVEGGQVPVGREQRLTTGGKPKVADAAAERSKAIEEAKGLKVSFAAHMANMRRTNPERAALIQGARR